MKCSSCKSEKTVKNGHKYGKQNYLCRACGYQFTSVKPRASNKIKMQAVALYCAGLSFRTIARFLNYSNVAVLLWVRAFAKEHYQKPIPKGEIVIELDEMWHFLQSKKTNCGFGKPIAARLENLLTGSAEIEIPPLLKECIVA